MDLYLYKLRRQVENTFRKLKRSRALAMRYDRLKVHYEGMTALAAFMLSNCYLPRDGQTNYFIRYEQT